MNRDFLKEAIADAKTVKESAIANAKAALEEAFEPRIKAMMTAKLEEMDKDDKMEEAKDEVDEAKKMKDEVEEEMSNQVGNKKINGTDINNTYDGSLKTLGN